MSDGTLKTPLHAEHLALGARMVPFAGWEMPIQYSGIIEEHRAVRGAAGIFDVSHMAEFRVSGIGAKDALQEIVANDLERIEQAGRAIYTVMCDEAGGIIDDLIVYRTGEFEFLVVGNAANRSTDAEWIAGHLPAGVEFADESDRTALVAVQGPAAIAVISELAEEGFEIPGRFTIAEALLDTIPALVSRTGYTGEDGVEIYCHAGSAAALWRALLSFPEVTPCGLGARDTLRLEMGYALYGTDMDRSVDPISAGLGWTVPKAKTGFIGAEAIARIRESGPASRLVGILLEEGVPRHGHPVLHESTEVGKVASGTYSPTLGRGIATAYVPSALAEPGTQLEVAVRRKVHRASVVRPPFVTGTSLESKS